MIFVLRVQKRKKERRKLRSRGQEKRHGRSMRLGLALLFLRLWFWLYCCFAKPYIVCVDIAQSAISMVIGSETRVIEATNSGVKSILQPRHERQERSRHKEAANRGVPVADDEQFVLAFIAVAKIGAFWGYACLMRRDIHCIVDTTKDE